MEYLPLKITNQFMQNTNAAKYVYGRTLKGKQLNWGTSLYHDLFDVFLNGNANKFGYTFPPTEEEFVKFFLSGNFIEDLRTNTSKYPLLLGIIVAHQEEVLSNLEGKAQKRYLENIITEMTDENIMLFLLNRWAQNKQVIKPDPNFAFHLMQTDKLSISKDILEHLPYFSFYLDLNNCKGIFEDCLGSFVFITKLSEGSYNVTLYLVCDENECALYSDYLSINGLDRQDVKIDVKDMKENEIAWDMGLDGKLSETKTKLPEKTLKTFVLQLLCYMSAEKPDFVPDKNMATTYRPTPGIIKNKFREVFINEVGYRIGANLLRKKKEVEELYEASDEYKNENPKTRKPPCAHYRRAHWQGYWVGKGRTEYVLKWKEPIFVCGTYTSEAVIHKASMPEE